MVRHGTRKETRKLTFDALEERTLLSGNCMATISRGGDLLVNCDNDDNVISVEQYGDKVEVEGHEGTTVNGQQLVELQGISRDVRISTRDGSDFTLLFQLDVPRNLNFNGGADMDFLSGEADTDVVGVSRVRAEQRGETPNVMEFKLNQAIQLLSRPNLAEQTYMDAIHQGIEAIYTSNLVVLPTPATNEIQNDMGADPEFDAHLAMLNSLISSLNNHATGRNNLGQPTRGLGTPGSQRAAGETENFLRITREAMQVIAGQTDFCSPLDQQTGIGCPFLQADDEGGNFTVDNVLGNIFRREVRSPFPFLLANTSLTPDEQVIVTDTLGNGDCAAIVKEIQGIKVVVTPRKIPIWVEPWFARARIVGFKTVWTWEFVPAEFIKTITVCNNNRTTEVSVTTAIVLDRQLLHFWRFLHKDVTGIAG